MGWHTRPSTPPHRIANRLRSSTSCMLSRGMIIWPPETLTTRSSHICSHAQIEVDRRAVFAVKRSDRESVLFQQAMSIGDGPHRRTADDEVRSNPFLPGGIALGETGIAVARSRQSEREPRIETGGAAREAFNI